MRAREMYRRIDACEFLLSAVDVCTERPAVAGSLRSIMPVARWVVRDAMPKDI